MKGQPYIGRAELVRRVCARTGGTDYYVETIVGGGIAEIQAALAEGLAVRLTGFGSFATRWRKARQGRNPQTGAALKIPARNMARFKPGKGLRQAINPKRSKS